jgi:hypothetical protein
VPKYAIDTTVFDAVLAQGSGPVLLLQYGASGWTAAVGSATAGNPVTDAIGSSSGTGATPMLALQAMVQAASPALQASSSVFAAKVASLNAVLAAASAT